jgi:YegS/Rv2252/BmrU family lipid kinase
MRALLVANPRAGRVGGARAVARLTARLEAAGLEVHPLLLPSSAAALQALRAALREASPENTRVVVAGGDGTLNALLPALVGSGIPVALLPMGTLNVLARDLGVPLRWEEAIALATTGQPHRVDVGVANGRLFADMVGIGYDAAIVHGIVPAGGKSRLHYPHYCARALQLLGGYRPRRLRLIADGERFEADAWMAVIANTTHYAYHWRVSPYAVPDDGLLDLCLFRSRSSLRMVGQTLALLGHRHAHLRGVAHLRARSFRLACDPPLPLQTDGDAAGWSPLEVSLLPQALCVLVPALARQVLTEWPLAVRG